MTSAERRTEETAKRRSTRSVTETATGTGTETVIRIKIGNARKTGTGSAAGRIGTERSMNMTGMIGEIGRGNGTADCFDLSMVKRLSEADQSDDDALTHLILLCMLSYSTEAWEITSNANVWESGQYFSKQGCHQQAPSEPLMFICTWQAPHLDLQLGNRMQDISKFLHTSFKWHLHS